ncbi:hypothetical protein [Sphingopyxis sp. KK2]|uniref:hypothetical protein n=1 Tax=Sphingopyxis sp. KK2 TaxID=1855727 RepID=UPI0015C3BCC1|nr:hypothetical protein [Sphingopyxis sp. KK2]
MQIDRVVKLGDQSCLCAMAGRDTSKLDRELERLTASLETKTWMTSSVPLRADGVCYPQLGERACVGRVVITHSRSDTDFVCTGKQADELLAVWEGAATDGRTYESLVAADKKRDAALLKRLRAMHAEAAAKIPQSACN